MSGVTIDLSHILAQGPGVFLVYYRLYNRDGEAVSKTAFDPHDRAVGRIYRNHVTPPHTAGAIRRCIAKVEENPRYICGTLYPDSFDKLTIPENVHLSLFSSRGGLGISVDAAVVLVEQERREGMFNRPIQCMVFMDRASVCMLKLAYEHS